ncbi:MAG: SRPBCC family protein [Acidimicrobiia bacterium]|nr:SRPBCC family protein [Acidimicrobiia bacterium]
MGPVRVSVDIPQAIERVWEEAGALDRHAEWMADAQSIEFLGPERSGVGTRLRVATRLGPLHTIDELMVTAWEPPRRIEVEHHGRFRGWGRFHLEPLGPARTRFTWEESIHFPWYLGGPLGALAARPIFTWVWRRNLARFRARLTYP